MHTWNSTTLYLDIDDYKSSVDIYYVDADDDAVPQVEKNVPFTYMSDLCKYVSKKYANARYIVPDKFYTHTIRDYPFYASSHVIRMNNRELLKILNFRASEMDRDNDVPKESFPKHYVLPGYERPYIPIARDAAPYTGNEDYFKWANAVTVKS